MLQQHPEVNQGEQVIGWQPVYSTQQQKQSMRSPQPNFLLGAAVGIGILCIAASGGVLWGKVQKTEAEVQTEIQQALVSERERITECVTLPENKKRSPFKTVRD
jgi:hypothetical protein